MVDNVLDIDVIVYTILAHLCIWLLTQRIKCTIASTNVQSLSFLKYCANTMVHLLYPQSKCNGVCKTLSLYAKHMSNNLPYTHFMCGHFYSDTGVHVTLATSKCISGVNILTSTLYSTCYSKENVLWITISKKVPQLSEILIYIKIYLSTKSRTSKHNNCSRYR